MKNCLARLIFSCDEVQSVLAHKGCAILGVLNLQAPCGYVLDARLLALASALKEHARTSALGTVCDVILRVVQVKA